MPRIARVVAVGYAHHITQRGNYGQKVFLEDKDKEEYISWIQRYSDKYGLSLIAVCLMTNHVHFIGIPEKEDSLAKTFNATHMRYSHYFNDKTKMRGHLWQGRFYSCVLDEHHLIKAARYIERNPVRAGLVKKPWEWQWSSAAMHIGINGKKMLRLGNLLGIINMNENEWKSYIDDADNEDDIKDIKTQTLTGRPLCEEQFIKELENKLGRKLVALPVGRPKKME
jgi:putative transposase